jgi:hypothetical protein
MKTRKPCGYSLILLLAALVFRAAGAQEVQAAATNRHSLWKVSGQRATVYLLGSVHFLKADNYPLAAPIESAFAKAAIVAFEMDPGQLQAPATLQKLMAKAMLPPGETFQEQLSAKTYSQFTNLAAEVGMPLFLMEGLKPAFGAFMLVELGLKKLGFDPDNGVEMHFYALARKQGKTVIPLESVDFQIDLLTSFSREETELLVKSTLEDIANLKKLLGDMVTAWQTGDAAGLDKLLNSMAVEAPGIFKRLLTDRTRQWAPKVEELSRGEKNAIVIVGAGHLVGKDGLVELLRKKGLQVTQE